MSRTRSLVAGIALAALLAGPAAATDSIRVGVSAGPHAEVLEIVKEEAAQHGLDIEIVEFTDYVVPNEALAAGEIEANSFQHQPYLDNQVADRGYKIVSVATTLVFPIGFYSETYGSFDEVPQGGTVAIQNDPTNGGRSLLLLQAAGVLKLRDGVGIEPTVADIVENPKGLKFLELDAAQLPRSLQDVDAASINTNYAIEAGLDPATDTILRESPNSPYANVIAVRAGDENQPWVQTLVAAYHTDKVKAFVAERFKGAVIATW
jgi:D-methionine transport system substrate-binding protein